MEGGRGSDQFRTWWVMVSEVEVRNGFGVEVEVEVDVEVEVEAEVEVDEEVMNCEKLCVRIEEASGRSVSVILSILA